MVWHLRADLTADQAQRFLVDDLCKSVLRAKYLYVELEPSGTFGRGIFEPILLALCWSDLLGALYTGMGKPRTSTDRTTRYFREMLAKVDARYADVAPDLVKTYRHGLVHAYGPIGDFHVSVSDAANHLGRTTKPPSVRISVANLLDDLAESIRRFASSLDHSGPAGQPGTLAAFNKARRELQKG